MIIAYAGHAGESDDRVYRGRLPQVVPTTVLDSSHVTSFTSVYRGNAAADGSITWSDVTGVASVPLFDTVNPTVDELSIEIDENDVLSGVSFELSVGAVLVGSPVIEVYHRTASGFVVVPATTPVLTAPGMVTSSFLLDGSSVALTDDQIAPRNPDGTPNQHRCALIRYSGITSVTTAPVATRILKRLSHDQTHPAADITAIVAQGANPDFSGRQSSIIPIQGDMLLFGFDELPLQLLVTVNRPSEVSAAQKEWVYSRSADFVAIPATGLDDPTAELTAAIPLSAAIHPSHQITSTYTGAAWGNSAVASTTQLVGDGYVEFKIGATPTAGGFVGFSPDAGDLNYTAIDYGYHIGHATAALASAFVNGTHQAASGTWAIATGDIMRMERRGDTFRLYQNGTLRHTFTQTSLANMVIDCAFVASCAVTDLVLVSYSSGLVPITWGTPTAVTLGAGVSVAIHAAVQARTSIEVPTDIARQSVMGSGGTSHTRYWIGLRQTSDAVGSVLPENLTMRALVARGAGAAGVPADQAAYTRITLARHPAPAQDATIAIVNTATGKVANVTLTAGSTTASATIALSGGAVNDPLAMMRVRGPEMDDSMIYIS